MNDVLDNPSFETKQRILRLVVDKILVRDEEITIQHTVPISDVRLWRDHYTCKNRSQRFYVYGAATKIGTGRHDFMRAGAGQKTALFLYLSNLPAACPHSTRKLIEKNNLRL